MKLWDGRFAEETDKLVEAFNASIDFDYKLYQYDIQGSIAHAKMLAKCDIISTTEKAEIISGLKEILTEIEEGEFEFSQELEDVHMNIEKKLTDKIGEAGAKLHTARSRNDQVAVDIRLYLRSEIEKIQELLTELNEVLLDLAEDNLDFIMPGYTHLQRAQPVRIAHHLLAYQQKFSRDYDRLADCYKRVNVLPLGSGALAGTPFAIDREFVAKELGFDKVSQNSMDAVSERDFIIEFSSAAATIMMHLSRFSEELILWASSEFDFVEISDAFCTGSSIMPQKKNPDIPELIRGKSGRVYGNLMQILTVMKSLPLAYNKDMQEDKEGLFDTVETIEKSLVVFTAMLKNIEFKTEEMKEATEKGFLNATDVADYLVNQGVAFRKAHEIVGKIVFYAIEQDKTLGQLSLAEWNKFSDCFTDDIYQKIELESSVDKRDTIGGPAKKELARVIAEEKNNLENKK